MFAKLLDNIGSSSKYIKRFKKSAKIRKCGICVQNSFMDALVIPMLRSKVKKMLRFTFLGIADHLGFSFLFPGLDRQGHPFYLTKKTEHYTILCLYFRLIHVWNC